MEKITSDEFIKLVVENGGKMSQATLARRLKDENFIETVGASKEKVDYSKVAVWLFDRELSEKYSNGQTGTENAPKSTAIVKIERKNSLSKLTDDQFEKLLPSRQGKTIDELLSETILLPHKLVLNLIEANKISGLPKEFLKKYGTLTNSGYKFTRETLDGAVTSYLKIAKVEKKPFGKVTLKKKK